jgi:hypothetical protein
LITELALADRLKHNLPLPRTSQHRLAAPLKLALTLRPQAQKDRCPARMKIMNCVVFRRYHSRGVPISFAAIAIGAYDSGIRPPQRFESCPNNHVAIEPPLFQRGQWR